MDQDHGEFGPLRCLLRLKRHERPPPGYFTHFSTKVIARIKAGEGTQQGFLEGLWGELGWLHHLWAAGERKPVLAGALGATAWVLLIAGLLSTVRPEGPPPVVQGAITITGSPGRWVHSGFLLTNSLLGPTLASRARL
jgi:hypothetical protein